MGHVTPASDRGRAAARRATQEAPRTRTRLGHLVLPAIALGLAAYVFLQPPVQDAQQDGSAPSGVHGASDLATAAADRGLAALRARSKARRANPGAAPPHLRDVVFE